MWESYLSTLDKVFLMLKLIIITTNANLATFNGTPVDVPKTGTHTENR